MAQTFQKEICDFFPFSPYEMQTNFMKVFYNILRNSNIRENENVHIFYRFLNENKNLKLKLGNDQFNGCLELTNINPKLENEKNEIEEDNYNHIICEMKTGSGKTLTLLSSIVYWFFKHKFELYLIREKIEMNDNEPKWVRERVIEKLLQKYTTILKTENEKKKKDEEILNHYFEISDEKIVLKENVNVKKKQTNLEKKEHTENPIVEAKNYDSLSDVSIEGQTRKQV